MNGSGQLDQVELHGLLRQGRKVSLAQNLQDGFHGAMPELSKGAEGEIELEAKLKGAAIRKAANERGARFTEAFGEIKVAEVPAKLKEMLDQRHERLRDVFNEWDLDRDGNLDRMEFAVGLAWGSSSATTTPAGSLASSTRMARGASTLPSLRTPCTRRGRRSSSPSCSAARSGTRRRAATRSRRASASCRARRRRRRPPPSSRAVMRARRSRRPKCRAWRTSRRRRSCCSSSSSSSRGASSTRRRSAATAPSPHASARLAAAGGWRAGDADAAQPARSATASVARSDAGHLAPAVSARALPLNRLSGNLSPRLASAVGGAAAVTPSQRVSHQSGLTLPALKSARTHALAAALNLSPRMLQRELRAPADKGRLDGAAHATLVASMLRSTGKLRGRPAVDGGTASASASASASAASLPTPQPPATPRVLGGGTSHVDAGAARGGGGGGDLGGDRGDGRFGARAHRPPIRLAAATARAAAAKQQESRRSSGASAAAADDDEDAAARATLDLDRRRERARGARARRCAAKRSSGAARAAERLLLLDRVSHHRDNAT